MSDTSRGRRLRLTRRQSPAAPEAPALSPALVEDAARAARQQAAATPRGALLTGVSVDPARGSVTCYLTGRETPLTLAVDEAGLPAAEQVAAIAALSAGGVPVIVAPVGHKVTLTTGGPEFAMHALSGITLDFRP